MQQAVKMGVYELFVGKRAVGPIYRAHRRFIGPDLHSARHPWDRQHQILPNR